MATAEPEKKYDWEELVNFRAAAEPDIDQLLEIEKQSFSMPWSKKMFLHELYLPFSYNRVAELKSDLSIAGFIFCWLSPPEASIMSIAVKPDLRRRGLGAFILAKALHDLKERDTREAYLEVRPGNAAAQALYKSFGFVQVGLRPRYYTDTNEDAIVMKKEL